MKANESLQNYESKVRESTNFIIKSIKTVCKDTPSRKAGSEGEEKAQQYVADTMEKFADSIEAQEISVKTANRTAPFYQGILAVISVVFAIAAGFVPAISLYLMISSVAVMGISVLLSYFKATRNSKNIICIKKPSGEAKKRIVFMGNINSPIERKLLRISGNALEKIAYFGFLLGCLICMVYAVLFFSLGNGRINPFIALFELIFIPVFLLYMNFYNPKQDIQGANGNLTGTFDSMAVIQYLSYNNLSLENTEIVSVSCGAGAYGAREFAKVYSKKFSDMPTVYVSVDCLQSDKCFGYSVLNTDSSLIETASKNAGVEIKNGRDNLSSSLLAGLKGLNAIRISAADEKENFVYAAREDTITEISPMAIEAGLKLSLETAYLYDEKGV